MAAGRREEGRRAGQPEDDEAGLQRALAAVAVAEGAGDEQQAGEDEEVGVDHPLQDGRRRVELALHGRQRHVEHGVVEADEDEAQAEDAEGLPAAVVIGLHGHAGTSRTGNGT
jgi:hypothetical protein